MPHSLKELELDAAATAAALINAMGNKKITPAAATTKKTSTPPLSLSYHSYQTTIAGRHSCMPTYLVWHTELTTGVHFNTDIAKRHTCMRTYLVKHPELTVRSHWSC